MSKTMISMRFMSLVSFVLLAGLFSGALRSVQPFGEPQSPVVDGRYLARAQTETGANDLVTAVGFDYRSFDIIALAGCLVAVSVSVVSLLREEAEEGR